MTAWAAFGELDTPLNFISWLVHVSMKPGTRNKAENSRGVFAFFRLVFCSSRDEVDGWNLTCE